MRNLAELNLNIGGKPVMRKPPSQKALSLLADLTKMPVEKDYIKFLMQSNGGHPQLNAFVPECNSQENVWSVDMFYHVDEDEIEHHHSVFKVLRDWKSQLRKGELPIGCDGGNNQICLGRQGEIFIIVADGITKRYPVASSFTNFIDLLHEDSEFI